MYEKCEDCAACDKINMRCTDDGMSMIDLGGVCNYYRRPTKHTLDVVDSAASSDIIPASEVSALEAESTPATTQVM